MNVDALHAAHKKFNALSLRERVIVFFATLAVMSVVLHQGLIAPAQKAQAPLRQKIASMRQELTLAKLKLGDFSHNALQKRLRNATSLQMKLLKTLEISRKKLNALGANIVSTQSVHAAVFKELLEKDSRLRLIDLKSTRKKVSSRNKSNHQKKTSPLAEQGMTLMFEGPYFVFVDYLKRLETLNWQLFWTSVHYHVTAYPNAKITLKLNVPSIDEKQYVKTL